jgi:hypothetical protein
VEKQIHGWFFDLCYPPLTGMTDRKAKAKTGLAFVVFPSFASAAKDGAPGKFAKDGHRPEIYLAIAPISPGLN